MRLIDADALKETIVTNVYPVTDYFNSRDYGMFWTGGIEKAIDEQPTIESERKGKWDKKSIAFYWKCSECGAAISNDRHEVFLFPIVEKLNFCPNCGADMRGD